MGKSTRALLAVALLALVRAAAGTTPIEAPGQARPQASDYDAVNSRPVIGILTQPTSRSVAYHTRGKSYIAASYVKWVESAGLRVMPVLYETPLDKLKVIMSSLSGLVIPGGRGDVTREWHAAAVYMLHEAAHMNRNGHYFPVWGTCDGFKLMVKIQAGPKRVFTRCAAENITVPLDFEELAKHTKLFVDAPDWLLEALQEDIAANNHKFCVTKKHFMNSLGLLAFRMLTTSLSEDGHRFVSTIEARRLPFYATQWHPEKNAFEWGAVAVDHTPRAIRAMQYFGSFFASEARVSRHRFDPALEDQLIYRFSPIYAQPIAPSFMQVYFFGPPVPLHRKKPQRSPSPLVDAEEGGPDEAEAEWEDWGREAQARGYDFGELLS